MSVVALAGCRAFPPRECPADGKQVLKCATEYAGRRDSEMLVACFPFSEPRRISGTWVYGFEHNAFFEREHASAKLLQPILGDTALKVRNRFPNDGKRRVFQVGVIGRQSLCDMGFPKHIIVAERVLSHSLVAISR